jgi:hypothetical protein
LAAGVDEVVPGVAGLAGGGPGGQVAAAEDTRDGGLGGPGVGVGGGIGVGGVADGEEIDVAGAGAGGGEGEGFGLWGPQGHAVEESPVHGECALAVPSGLAMLPQTRQHGAQVGKALGQVGVVLLGVEALPHGQGALVIPQRPAMLPLRLQQQEAQVVEALGQVRVAVGERLLGVKLLADGQGPLLRPHRLPVGPRPVVLEDLRLQPPVLLLQLGTPFRGQGPRGRVGPASAR